MRLVSTSCFVFSTLSLIALIGCAPSSGSSLAKQASKPEGSAWTVTAKYCGPSPVPPLKNEKFQFAEGKLAYTYQSSENDESVCVDLQSFDRIVQSTGFEAGEYKESAQISPHAFRIQCKNKGTQQVQSDETRNASGVERTLVLKLGADTGSVEISAMNDCMWPVRFNLKKE